MENILLMATRAGIRFAVEGNELRLTAPQGALNDELRQGLSKHKNDILKLLQSGFTLEELAPVIVEDEENRYAPFPLTDLQHAYWLGRGSSLEMGGVATHLYLELDCQGIDIGRLNGALCRMIERHDMLRAVVKRDGMQQVLEKLPDYVIAVNDQSLSTPEQIELAIESARSALSHQVFKPDQWPLFEVRATRLPSSAMRLHVSLDLLILDAWSIFLFFKEWHELYQGREVSPPVIGVTFRDYLLAEQKNQASPSYQKAYHYWMDRIDTLPPAPDLPLKSDLAVREKPRFVRREARLERSRWERLRSHGRAEGLTPSGLLLAAYSEILSRWSGSAHFTLNVTVSNRRPLHKDVNNLLGDFTSLVMHEVDHRDTQQSFIEFASNLQKQFATDLDNRELSGVTVLRELAKRRGITLQAAMPVVFSSGLVWSGDEEVGNLEQFGKKVYSISQTSQVWLDHHVMELDGDLVFIWDAADAVFEDGVLDAMFASYCELIERLADEPELWLKNDVTSLPSGMQRRRQEANQTTNPNPRSRLHSGFVEQAHKQPHAPALIAADRCMSYSELLAASSAVANRLVEQGLEPGDMVGVLMHKGWEQVVAVCGVLMARGVYLPVDADLPLKRQMELLRIGNATHVLTQAGSAAMVFDANIKLIEVTPDLQAEFGELHALSVLGDDNDLAYVIFTSGTTGTPKGVMIDHRGAMNTIRHVSRLFSIGANYRVLAVSSLSFDLSVYDIFGLLDVGGCLVIPDYRKGHDPVHWRQLITQHQVTLWNSAPQLMRMLMDGFTDDTQEMSHLRTVFLSGDFIPLDLPQRIRSRYPLAEVNSLGGATEASIWSIYYPIDSVSDHWSSIPYGKPLPNQSMWVYDHAFRPCPDYVQGHIYIGGMGLAMGYWMDPEKTNAKFVRNPYTGERLYDTGDLGRYLPDGNLSILGREDGQIKIRGHRVETGEIEAVLRRHPAVRQVAVLATGDSRENKQLAAYVEFTESQDDVAARSQALKAYLGESLPDYMIPRYIVPIDRIPVSSNGKIDYRALPDVSLEDTQAAQVRVLPRNPAEQTLYDVWSTIIAVGDIGVTDNFFELGGDSILATQLVRELNLALPEINLEMHELFENLTIESLAQLAQSRMAGKMPEPVAPAHIPFPSHRNTSTSPDQDVLEDVRNISQKISELSFSEKSEATTAAPSAILLTGATGWVGSYVLAELLLQTTAQLYCLVRADSAQTGMQHLTDSLHQRGVTVDPAMARRIHPVCGDLGKAGLGLEEAAWQELAAQVEAVYHFAASVNVLADYTTHRKVNVTPIAELLRLVAEHHAKAIYTLSPMTVCRRRLQGKLVVLGDETLSEGPEGLLTGYAQSKWAAEKILQVAGESGLVGRIYRSSHALPSAQTGQAKPGDTYTSILKLAAMTPVIPDWDNSSLYGVPVDRLAHLIVEDSLQKDRHFGVVHLENNDPLSLKSIIEVLHRKGRRRKIKSAYVTLDEWKIRCQETADNTQDEGISLARVLFTERSSGAAVENMFGKHPINTDYFTRRGQASKLSQLTPAAYWRLVCSDSNW